ncbi:MAG: hypothetical protein RI903_672, partial [Bacteroidota bacterium]
VGHASDDCWGDVEEGSSGKGNCRSSLGNDHPAILHGIEGIKKPPFLGGFIIILFRNNLGEPVIKRGFAIR